MNQLKKLLPDLIGNIEVIDLDESTMIIKGDISTKDDSAIEKIVNHFSNQFPRKFIQTDLKLNQLNIVYKDKVFDTPSERELDEVNILYFGKMDISLIKENKLYRNRKIDINMEKLDNCVKVFNFISPIILDSELRVIDGDKRLTLAKENGINEVLVVVIDDKEKRANALRLALNRSSEFQKWNYVEIDDFIDDTPQAQPLMEPLGFFGRKVLPVSFFSKTILKYEIDPFNKKQAQYTQDYGLAEWAKIRREEMEQEAKRKREKKKKADKKQLVSLFDLIPSENDFLDTYDADTEINEHIKECKDRAEIMTQAFDDERRPIFEAQGRAWQSKSYTSKQVADRKRKEAIQYIENADYLTESQKDFILENLEDFAGFYKNKKEMLNVLSNKGVD